MQRDSTILHFQRTVTVSESSGSRVVMWRPESGEYLKPHQTTVCVSRLGPREREHHDLVVTEACDVDLVAVHEDCTDSIFQTEANLLQDFA